MKPKLILVLLLTFSLKGLAQNSPALSKNNPSLPAESLSVHLNTTFFVVGETLLFKVYCHDQTGKASSLSSLAYVELIGHDGNPLTQMKIKLENGEGQGDLFFGAATGTGNYTLIAYTKWMRNFSQENFFREIITVINPGEKLPLSESNTKSRKQSEQPGIKNLLVHFDKKQYRQRDHIKVELQNKGSESLSLSVSVRLNDSIAHPAGNVENKIVPGEADSKIKFLADVRGELISGTITNKSDGKPFSNGIVALSSPSKNFEFLTSLTDSSGRYFFNTTKIVTDFYLLKILGRNNDEFVITPDSPFLEVYDEFIPPKMSIDARWIKNIGQRSLASQVENAFYAVKKDSVPESPNKVHFFNTPDKIYRLDDFTRFSTMDDIFREIITEIVVRQKTGNYSLSLRNIVTGERFANVPLVLIDGVPVSDMNMLMNYSPALIKTVSVVTHHYYYGALEVDGILNIETYKGNAERLAVSDQTRFAFKQIEPSKIYYAPDYGEAADLTRVPDYRAQLYWNPSTRLNAGDTKTLTFFTSDLSGEFLLEIAGVNARGERVYYEDKIVVR